MRGEGGMPRKLVFFQDGNCNTAASTSLAGRAWQKAMHNAKKLLSRFKPMASRNIAEGPNTFSAITVKSGAARIAALTLDSKFSKPPTAEDREALEAAKEGIKTAGLGIDKERTLLDYIKIAQGETGGRFSLTQAAGVVGDYLKGEVTEKELDFQVRLMHAWCNGKVAEFISAEVSSISSSREIKLGNKEKSSLVAIPLLCANAGNELKAVAAQALAMYYGKESPSEREELLAGLSELLS